MKNLVFEDKSTEAQTKRGKILLIAISSIMVGLATHLIVNILFPGNGLIAGFLVMILSLIIFSLKKIPDYMSGPTFKIYEDGVWIEHQNQFYGWNIINKIELLKGSNPISGEMMPSMLPKMGLIMGEKVIATDINLTNDKLIEVQNVLQNFGIKVAIK